MEKPASARCSQCGIVKLHNGDHYSCPMYKIKGRVKHLDRKHKIKCDSFYWGNHLAEATR